MTRLDRSRLGHVGLVIALLATGQPPGAAADEGPPLQLRIEAERGPHYVGQGIELGVAVTGRDERPVLELPPLRDARILSAGNSVRAVSSSSIGRLETGENLFLTRLRVIPAKAGPLEIPAIVARLGERVGKTQAIRLKVEPVPAEGRPATFLGGVGDFRVEATASAASVRLGQPITLRIAIQGPAAWGSRLAPDLSKLAELTVAPRVEELPQENVDDPPSRVFAYRIRPTKPGDAVLPPVAVSAFDPGSGRYFTKVTRSLPFHAVAVPVLESTAVESRVEPRAGGGLTRFMVLLAAVTGPVVVGLAVWLQRRREEAGRDLESRRSLARRGARSYASRLGSGDVPPADRFAAELMERLTAHASMASDRPAGALTPGEARAVFRSLTGSAEQSERAGRLVEWCDLALFSDREAVDGLAQARIEAAALFKELGRPRVGLPRFLGGRRSPR
ncbi:BatD family protein [Aquisphaera insulae]|uniref:BatD family protein n=1 Tax=Aquisphaera insulae TaxID=2712864 RepID=UPI0013EC4882|nr:BatD family protein [Aquisphaera insulae]